MAEAPIISIVTPSYNQGEFLEETLVSVLSQEGDFYLDYLVIDGGSDDCSPQLIQAYAERLETGEWPIKCRGVKFRWLSEKDRGQTDAIIKGFGMAEGVVLAWLNSDDVYLPGALQTVTAYFQQNLDVALLYGDANYCNTEGAIIGRYPTEDFHLAKLAYFSFICQPSTFFRREAYQAVGGLDDTLAYSMDYDLFVRIGKSFICKYLPQEFSRYRLHLDSKTMRDEVLSESHGEALRLALRHFGWAPLNLVYGNCHYYCLSRMPKFLRRNRFSLLVVSLLCTCFQSLWLNKGLKTTDLQLLKISNLRKIFKSRVEILLDQSS